MPPVNLSIENAKLQIEHSIKYYVTFHDYYKSYKEGEHSKISTFMYGLVAVAIFALLTGNGGGLVHKFWLSYSIIFTLVGYYFWYLTDALILNLILLCNSAIEYNKKILAELSKGSFLDPESFLVKKTLEVEAAIKCYYKFSKFISWSCLGALIVAAVMVLLGVFWINFKPPIFLENTADTSYHSAFYWTLLWIALIIIFFQALYYKIANDYIIKDALK